MCIFTYKNIAGIILMAGMEIYEQKDSCTESIYFYGSIIVIHLTNVCKYLI